MQQTHRAYGPSTLSQFRGIGNRHTKSRRVGPSLVAAFAIALAGFATIVSADPAAHFELRLGASESDSVVNIGESLELEVWVEITDPPDANTTINSVAFFLKADTSEVITYNGDFVPAPAFSGWSPLSSGMDNLPDTGDFDRAYFTFLTPTADGIGAPTRLGTFTVSGLELGTVGYEFAIQIPQRVWSVGITGQILQGPQVTGSIAPEVASIEVVDEPIARSADADGDCDIDLRDYRELQLCAVADGQMVSTNGCELLDLNGDNFIDGADTNLLVEQITGAMPWPGDMDIDGDVDLADYARFQICLTGFAEPGLEELCAYIDINRDSSLDENDYKKFHDNLAGPQ